MCAGIGAALSRVELPLYISTIDFTKALDRIKHSALWSSLKHYGIGPSYVKLVQRLYSQQEGVFLTDKESDVYPIKRGTKQRDPLSSLLFNTVLQFSLEQDLKRMAREKKGIRLSDKKRGLLDKLTICRRCVVVLDITAQFEGNVM